MYSKNAIFIVFTLLLIVILPSGMGILIENNKQAIDQVFPALISNDKVEATSIFTLNNQEPKTYNKSALQIEFNQVYGKVIGYKILVLKDVLEPYQLPIYKQTEICRDYDGNKSLPDKPICRIESTITGYTTEYITISKWVPVDAIPPGSTNYKIEADIDFSRTPNGWGYSIDWIPKFITDTKSYTQDKYAWWNVSYSRRIPINCTNMVMEMPLLVNSTGGINIGGAGKEVIWTNCKPVLYLYYNDGDQQNYTIGNETSRLPYEVEKGTGISFNPASVWTSDPTFMFMNTFSTINNSVRNTNASTNSSFGGLLSDSNCFSGGCVNFTKNDNNDYIVNNNVNIPTFPANTNKTILVWINPIEWVYTFYFSFGTGGSNQRIIAGFDAGGWLSNTDTWLFMSPQIKPPLNVYELWGYMGNGSSLYQFRNQTLTNSRTDKNLAISGTRLTFGSDYESDQPSSGNWRGYMDDFRLYNRTLTTDELGDIYYNYVNVAGYGLVGVYEEGTNPAIKFNNQTPADLNVSNLITTLTTIYFNITSMNISTLKLLYLTNSTTEQATIYKNGTLITGFLSEDCDNVSSAYMRCILDDNEILPGTYNLEAEIFEDNLHTSISLANQNTWLKTSLFNVSSSKKYGFYEFMGNKSGTAPLLSYFCNSSYSTGNPLTSTSCGLLSSLANSTQYSHTHMGGLSQHHVIVFSVNDSKISGVKITNTSYFLQRGDNANDVIIYGLNNQTRADTITLSTNGGVSWSNQVFTTDSHLHQLDNTSQLNYYGSATGTDGLIYNTTRQKDILGFFDLPPGDFLFYSFPIKIVQNTTIRINWTASASPNNKVINYTTTLFYINFTGVRSLLNSQNQFLIYNATDRADDYLIEGYATDTDGLTSGISFSGNFEICDTSFYCSDFDNCNTQNITPCLIVTDNNSCTTYTGNLTFYDGNCTYIVSAETINLTNFNILGGNNVWVAFILAFLWIGVCTLSLAFKNFAFGSFAFFIGIFLGFLFFPISPIMTILFFFMNVIFFIRNVSNMR